MSRENKAVLIVHGSHTLRAGYGIHNDLFRRPAYELTARVGLPRAFLAAQASTSAEGVAALPAAEDYVVGDELDQRISAGEPFEIYWPVRRGVIQDWQACIALWRHLLFRLMPLRPSLNDSPILLALPAPVSRAAHSIITRVFFELFNAPSLSIVETPLLSSYACGTLSSVVVDVGWESCSVSPVLDCAVQHAALTRCNVGLRHCALYLAHLLRRDASLTDALIKLDSRHAASTSRTGESASDAQETLHQSFAALALQLIHEKHARFEAGDLPAGAEQQNDDEEFDVAAALIAGREKAAIEEQEARNKAALAGSDPEAQAIAAKAASQASKPSDDVQPGANDEEGAVQTVFRGVRLQVGPGPLGQVAEPLFNPAVLANVRGIDSGPDLGQRCFGAGSLPDENIDLDAMERAQGSSAPAASRSLPELISIAIASIPEDDKRALLWETLVVTGAPTIGLKGLAGAVTAACANYVASASSNSGGGMGMMTGGMDGTPGIGAAERSSAQPTNVRSLRVPDYFAEFKERTDLAPFLGATIYGKLTFSDPSGRNYVSKAAYNERGPAASFAVLSA